MADGGTHFPPRRRQVVVIVPVLGRPHNAQPLVETLTASDADARLVFICSPDDEEEIAACRSTGTDTLVADWYAGHADWARKCELARATSDEPFMLLAADDVSFRPGWDREVLDIFARYDVGVVGTNDLANPTVQHGFHSTHPVVCRGYADAHGTIDDPALMLPQCYHHNWVDVELIETAKARGCWAFAPDAHVPHSHPIWGTATLDATYLRGRERYEQDARLFQQRRRLWERVAA